MAATPRLIAALGIGLALSTLAGCSVLGLFPGGAPTPAPRSPAPSPGATASSPGGAPAGARPLLTPLGADAGAWLAPGYADGLGRTFDAEGTPCGVTPDGAILLLQARNAQQQLEVRALDLTTGEKLWSTAPGSCEPGAVIGTVAVVARATEKPQGGYAVAALRVRASDGEVLTEGDVPDDLGGLTAIGEDGRRTYLFVHAEESSIMAMNPDGSTAWSAPVPPGGTVATCRLLDETLGCGGTASASLAWALNTGDGSFRVQPFRSTEVTWAHDGYVMGHGATAFVAHDLSGSPVGVDVAAVPGLPAPNTRTSFRLADFASGVTAVDRDGRAVLVEEFDQFGLGTSTFAQTGVALPDAGLQTVMEAVSSDGAVVAYRPSRTGTTLLLRTSRGTQVGSLDVKLDPTGDTGITVDMMGGLLVSSSASGLTTVYFPRGS